MLLVLAKYEILDQSIRPLSPRLVHHRVVSKEPTIELLFRQYLMNHLFVNLLLILKLGIPIPAKIVSL